MWSFTVWASVAVLLWTPALVWLAAGGGSATLQSPAHSGRVWMISRVGVVPSCSSCSSRPDPCIDRPSASRFRASASRDGASCALVALGILADVAVLRACRSLGPPPGASTSRHLGHHRVEPRHTGGGVVGESKFHILSRLPSECTIPSALVEAGVQRDE